jgi:hypothetical protein
VAVRFNRQGPHQLQASGRRLDPDATLRTLGMKPLDRIDLVWDQGASS